MDQAISATGDPVITNKGIFGKYVSILHRQEQRHLSHVMQEYDVRPFSYPLLIYLYLNEGVNQRRLCQILSLDEALATRTMRKLEAEGYVHRERDPNDQRSYLLTLTKQGRELAEILKEELVNWWGELFADVDEESIALLDNLMDRMSTRAVELNKMRSSGAEVLQDLND